MVLEYQICIVSAMADSWRRGNFCTQKQGLAGLQKFGGEGYFFFNPTPSLGLPPPSHRISASKA